MAFFHLVCRIAIPLMVLASSGACAGETRLVVKQEPDPTEKYPESKLYIGVLVNSGAADLPLKGIQMPGGYVGSGTFFNRSLDEWNARKKSWVQVKSTDVKGFANPRMDVVMVPGHEERPVCRQMLPHEVGHAGSCLRFRLAESWESGSRRWISTPFIIGEATGARRCP